MIRDLASSFNDLNIDTPIFSIDASPRWPDLDHFTGLSKFGEIADATKFEDLSKVRNFEDAWRINNSCVILGAYLRITQRVRTKGCEGLRVLQTHEDDAHISRPGLVCLPSEPNRVTNSTRGVALSSV